MDAVLLAGSEIHGFHTMADLDVANMLEEAKSRWLRPNEIHALLCNYKYFNIHAKPLNLPKSGTVVLYDRKMLRNFRRDGHNWKKKNDGKTIKEAHEHLKVGNEERIHVYYAHGHDNLTFVRRCYWLLDKSLEHIVLVHYRETQELQGAPDTPVNSNSSSGNSDISVHQLLSDGTDSGHVESHYTGQNLYSELGEIITEHIHEKTLHEINTLEWDELLVTNDPANIIAPKEGTQTSSHSITSDDNQEGFLLLNNISSEINPYLGYGSHNPGRSGANVKVLDEASFLSISGQLNTHLSGKNYVPVNSSSLIPKESLQNQDSFGRWMNDIIVDSPRSDENSMLEQSLCPSQAPSGSFALRQSQSSFPDQIFTITDISPGWAFSTENTKILLTGFFHKEYAHLAISDITCVCGDASVSVEVLQVGVFRCFISPHKPGFVNIYLSLDGSKPISQVLTFEYRSSLSPTTLVSSEDTNKWMELRMKTRLTHLLYLKSKSLDILSSKLSQNSVKEAKKFALKTSHIANRWAYLIESLEDQKISFHEAQDDLLELSLRNRLREWLLESIIQGSKIAYLDDEGLGVIHMCAILEYTWAVYLYSKSGLSLDFRDKNGWTALHWAAFYGREKMTAALLSAGAKPNLVTDPTPEHPGGCTAADLASKQGYEGVAAYLAEKGLVEHFNDMSIAGNVSGSLQTYTPDPTEISTLNEEEQYLKESLAAYRTAADAAARIQTAMREHALKVKAKAVEVATPEAEARAIVAAMKIQHAFRNFETRKKIVAAGRIQQRFRTWKIRKDFLQKRHKAIKIQAVFRGYQVRRQYRKILWSVGVLEKAILRWRLKRKGFRGLQLDPDEALTKDGQEPNGEEDFFEAGRKQAEERVERSVIKVQAMFRSKQAQQEYQRMKLAHTQAKLEYEEFVEPEMDTDS
uniref:CG-1 domain-containing protein n=1 Tax=Kalanchoe fedtschenkoi TaxID=63787 RepID=A0A7N0TKA0_KALFE